MKIGETIFLVFLFLSGKFFAASPLNNNTVEVSFSAPGIVGYLVDSNGQRDGIDPSVNLDSFGRQLLNGLPYQLDEIINSSATQTNNGGQQITTLWEIFL